ncbi:MAG: endonuclease [Elusimicrobiales bacterium]|nr:endonuclease [Elusimicrobiales bacterium]
MKLNGVLLAAVLTVLPFSRLAAQAPAFEALRVSAAGVDLSALPQPEARLFNAPLPGHRALSGKALFDYLHQATVPAPRKAFPSYDGSRAFMYSKADNAGCNGAPGIITLYSRVCVNGSSDSGNAYRETGDMNKDGVVDNFINAEHIWPQSYFNSALPMVADLHHLAPTFPTPNGRRGNLRFARVSKPIYSTSSGSMLGKEGFEPADEAKGNVARAIFYFVVRYHDRNIRQGMDYTGFWINNVQMLLEWNRQDPPDAAELRRNALVEEFQGNRNPFIDEPALAEQIGADVFRAH